MLERKRTMEEKEVTPTTAAAKTIEKISQDTVHKICSGQVKEFSIILT